MTYDIIVIFTSWLTALMPNQLWVYGFNLLISGCTLLFTPSAMFVGKWLLKVRARALTAAHTCPRLLTYITPRLTASQINEGDAESIEKHKPLLEVFKWILRVYAVFNVLVLCLAAAQGITYSVYAVSAIEVYAVRVSVRCCPSGTAAGSHLLRRITAHLSHYLSHLPVLSFLLSTRSSTNADSSFFTKRSITDTSNPWIVFMKNWIETYPELWRKMQDALVCCGFDEGSHAAGEESPQDACEYCSSFTFMGAYCPLNQFSLVNKTIRDTAGSCAFDVTWYSMAYSTATAAVSLAQTFVLGGMAIASLRIAGFRVKQLGNESILDQVRCNGALHFEQNVLNTLIAIDSSTHVRLTSVVDTPTIALVLTHSLT